MGFRSINEETGKYIIERYCNGAKMTHISNELNNSVSTDTIKKYLKENCVFRERKYWSFYTKEECELIGKLYQEDKWYDIFKKFPLITKQTVYTMCSELHFSKEEYFRSKEDIEYLINNYGKISIKDIAHSFSDKHTYVAVRAKIDKLGISKSKLWTDEENAILINNYSYVPKETMISLLPNRTPEAIMNHAKELGIKSYHYLNEKYSQEQKQFIIDNWLSMTDEQIAKILDKTSNGIRDQRASLGLCRVNKQYAKYENLAKLFRGHIQEWKINTMKSCNYQCVFTGSKDFAIHHLYGFNKILEESFQLIEQEIQLISDNTYDYSKEQLDRMIEIFRLVHDKYPLGVCIRTDIHDLFHLIYGAGGNTQEQWEKFATDFRNGKYNDRITI